MMVGKNNFSKRIQGNLTEHYKMYKAGRTWLFAAMTGLTLGLGVLGTSTAQADDQAATSTAPTVSSASGTSAQLSGSQVTLTTSSTTAASETSTTLSSAASTVTSSTASSAVTSENTSAASSATSTATSTTVSDSTATTTSAATSNTTTLNNPTSTQIATAKASAAVTYQQTGQAQQITAVADAVQATVTVGTTTKTYDGDAGTPLNYNVTLGNGMVAPSDWFVTGVTNQYLVAQSTGDLDTSQIQQNVGSYTVTLSAAGLAAIKAANPDVVLTSDDIVAGQLVIDKASVSAGSVVITGGSKKKDGDQSTDPTSYVVTLDADSHLVAPSDWTDNGDGTYTVAVTTGDLDVQITSQDVGRYRVTLSTQGLARLNAANANYQVTADDVTVGIYQILSNNQAVIGTVSVNNGSKLSGVKATVTVTDATNYQVPSDWTVAYNNTGQNSIVYSVPMTYFDTSNIDLSTNGSYELTFSDEAIATLNAANSELALDANNIQAGTVTVHAAVTGANSFSPSNYYVEIKGIPRGSSFTASVGSYLTLQMKLLRDSTADGHATEYGGTGIGKAFTNLTEYLVIPTGFVIGDLDADGNAVVASDPTASVKAQLVSYLTSYGIEYSDLSVTQETDYNGRQVFKIKFGQVVSNSNAFELNIITDPNAGTLTGHLGTQVGSNDDSVMYITDNYADTQGAYTVPSGAYVSVKQIAAALGIDDAYVLNDSYGAFVYAYTIINNVKSQDTYQFVGTGNVNLGSAQTSGLPGTIYATSSVVPTQITKNGDVYQLVTSSVNQYNTYPFITQSISNTTTVATGTTYTVTYVKVVDVTKSENQVKFSQQTMVMETAAPSTYTVQLPSYFNAPTSWTLNADGSYTIQASSGDIDTDLVSTKVGTYSVKLSALGLAKLAAANTGYLFTNPIVVAGTTTVTPIQKAITVSVSDTAGTKLVADQTINLSVGDGQSTTGANATADGYPIKQLHSITLSFASGEKTVWTANKADDSLIVTNYGTDGAVTSETVIPVAAMGTTASEFMVLSFMNNVSIPLFSFGGTSTLTEAQEREALQYDSVAIVYNQPATLTVTYVDDKAGQFQVGDSVTLTGFEGDAGSYDAVVPVGYSLATGQNKTVAYTLTLDDTDNITIHLVNNGRDVDESQTLAQLTVHYVDEAGHQLSEDKTSTGKQGDSFTETAAIISGYTPTEREISGTYQGNVMDLTFTYTKDGVTPDESQTPVKLTVHYVDENGNQLSADKEATGIQGDSFTEAAVAVSGYTPTQREINGTYQGNVMDLTFTYTKDGVVPDESQTPVKLTVHYVDENGNQLSADKEVTGTQGTDFTESAVAVSGYTPTEREISGTYQGNVMDLTFTYTKDGVTPDESQTPVKLTVHYVDENGNQLSADKEVTGTQGTDFTESAVAVAGYTPTQREVSGTYKGNVMDLTFTYTKDGVTPDESQTPVKLTVHYVDENGNQLSADKETTGIQGDNFEEAAAIIPGYTPTEREISGTYQGNVMDLTFTYTKDGVTPDESQTPVKLTVHYVDEDGNQLSADKEVTGTQGTDFTESAAVIDGYTSTQREISGTYQGNVMNLTFVYTKDGVTPDESQTPVKLTIHYVDENGNQLSADKEVTGTQGTGFTENAVAVSGYTPTQREISGTYQGNVMNLTFVYTKDGVTPDESQTPVKLTVHYVDENGNQLSADKEVTGTQGIDFTENAVAVSGYTPTQREISGTYQGNVMNLTFTYTKDGVTPDESQTPVKLTIHYVDENGNQLSADKEVTGTQGTDFTENAVAVSGYTPTHREISGTYQGNVMNLTFVYMKDGVTPDESQTPVKLTVHYVDENGNQLSADKEVTGTQGTDFTETAVAVSGYTPTQREISGTYKGNVMNLTFVYTKDGVTPDESQTPVKLTVHYVDENGNQLSADKEVTGMQGTDFTETAVAVSGYTPTQREIGGTYQGNVMSLTFVYTLNDSDNNGQPTLPDDGNNKPGTDGSTPVTPETTDPTLKPSGENTVATGDHTGNVKNDHPTGTSRDTTPIELDQATGITQDSDHTQATSSKDQQESEQKLPQTDQRQETMLTVIGLALMSMLGLLGIGKKSRRN